MADEELQDQQRPADEDAPESEDLLEEQEDAGEAEEEAEPSLAKKLKDVIDVQVEEVATLRKKLTITVPDSFLSEHMDEQYQELKNEAQVPGFRRGRAPRRAARKTLRLGGARDRDAAALGQCLPGRY